MTRPSSKQATGQVMARRIAPSFWALEVWLNFKIFTFVDPR